MFGRSFGDDGNWYCPAGYAEGDWRKETADSHALLPLTNAGSNNYSRDAKEVRGNLKSYLIQNTESSRSIRYIVYSV